MYLQYSINIARNERKRLLLYFTEKITLFLKIIETVLFDY